MVGLEEAKTLLNPNRSITASAATVHDRDLINHYGMFVAHLETLFLKSCENLSFDIRQNGNYSINSKEKKHRLIQQC